MGSKHLFSLFSSHEQTSDSVKRRNCARFSSRAAGFPTIVHLVVTAHSSVPSVVVNVPLLATAPAAGLPRANSVTTGRWELA